jgi:hypothetical protein
LSPLGPFSKSLSESFQSYFFNPPGKIRSPVIIEIISAAAIEKVEDCETCGPKWRCYRRITLIRPPQLVSIQPAAPAYDLFMHIITVTWAFHEYNLIFFQ